MVNETIVGKLVIAKTATGEIQGTGEVVSYCDVPSVSIKTMGGILFQWRADLCEKYQGCVRNRRLSNRHKAELAKE